VSCWAENGPHAMRREAIAILSVFVSGAVMYGALWNGRRLRDEGVFLSMVAGAKEESSSIYHRLFQFIHKVNSGLCKSRHVIKGELGNPLEPDVHVCFDQVQPPCTVLSFGIGDNFVFDDLMLSVGCRVFSFDPSMGSSTARKKRHPTRHFFFEYGLGPSDGPFRGKSTLRNTDVNGYAVKRFRTICTELNITQVDVLRIDCEACEWDVLGTIPWNMVHQFLLEVHFYDGNAAETQLRILEQIALSSTLQLFHSERNRNNNVQLHVEYPDVLYQVYELGFIRP